MIEQSVHLTVLRHGETGWNRERRIQGHEDTELSDTGRLQCKEVARRLAPRQFDHIYSSDLRRTMDTAAAVAEGRGLPIIEDVRLREWHFGRFQGLTIEEAKARFQEAFARFQQLAPALQVPGGESYETFFNRSLSALESIAANHLGQRLLIVTHGGFINNLLHHVWGISIEERKRIHTKNVCVITLELSPCQTGMVWRLLDSDIALP